MDRTEMIILVLIYGIPLVHILVYHWCVDVNKKDVFSFIDQKP
jgi:hypothetical protein